MRATREFGFKPTRGGSKYPSSHGPAKFGIARTLLGHIPNSCTGLEKRVGAPPRRRGRQRDPDACDVGRRGRSRGAGGRGETGPRGVSGRVARRAAAHAPRRHRQAPGGIKRAVPSRTHWSLHRSSPKTLMLLSVTRISTRRRASRASASAATRATTASS